MKSKFFAVATFAFAMAFAVSAGAVYQTDIYTAQSGYLSVGSGYGAKAYQNANVKAAQTALNACMPGMSLSIDGKFGPLTADKFGSFQASKGIKVDRVIGPVTAGQLAACSGNVTPTTPTTSTTLSGGAGDADITTTSTDVESSLKEDESDVNILGFEVEADGSDINVSSVKVSFKNNGYASSSEKLSDYVDSVSIMMGDDEVGSEDVADFSKDSGTPDEFSKTISLSNAVVDEDDKVKFYVAVSAVSTIDSDDITNAAWDIQIDTIRFNDATGAILSGDVTDLEYADNDAFTFDDSSADDDISIKSSSTDPDAATLLVEESTDSDEFLVGAFKLDVDEDSSDIVISEIPVVLTFAASGTTTDDANADSSEDVVDEVRVKVGSDWYDATFDSEAMTNGVGTGTYLVEDEFTIDAGDAPVVGIYVTFKEQDSNYGSGATVYASVTGSGIEAEGEDNVTVSSTFTGETHTLSTTAGSVDVTNITEVGNSNDSDDSYEEGTFTFYVTIDADEGDVDVDAASIVETLLDPASNTVALTLQIVNLDGDATENTAGTDYTVEEGDSNTFAIIYTINPDAAGAYYVRLDSIDGVSIDDTTEGVNLVVS